MPHPGPPITCFKFYGHAGCKTGGDSRTAPRKAVKVLQTFRAKTSASIIYKGGRVSVCSLYTATIMIRCGPNLVWWLRDPRRRSLGHGRTPFEEPTLIAWMLV